MSSQFHLTPVSWSEAFLACPRTEGCVVIILSSPPPLHLGWGKDAAHLWLSVKEWEIYE